MQKTIQHQLAKGDIRANFEKLKSELRAVKYINPLE